jgi:hypothetical protein
MAMKADGWERFWFQEIPPYSYALLRILLGAIGFASLLGLRDVSAFWSLSGLVPAGDGGLGFKAFAVAHGFGDVAGAAAFAIAVVAFACMTIGFRTVAAVGLSLIMCLLGVAWNPLPLSGANSALQMVLFCLIWADCGAVWSVDAWLERRRHPEAVAAQPSMTSIAPLRLVRFQVAMIYLSSGCWKLLNQPWRDGSALHYVLNTNLYRRFPQGLPLALDPLATLLTYATLAWELGFAFMVLWRPTRKLALLAGIAIHTGILMTMEIGPFSWVMMSTYVAFLDPSQVASTISHISAVFRLNRVPTTTVDATS